MNGVWVLTEALSITSSYPLSGINYSTQGMFPTPSTPLRSRQGYDLLFATNYLGHFLLTDLLMSLLKSTKGARVLQVRDDG